MSHISEFERDLGIPTAEERRTIALERIAAVLERAEQPLKDLADALTVLAASGVAAVPDPQDGKLVMTQQGPMRIG